LPDAPRTGPTVGVEEEYHLVDPETMQLLALPALSRQADERAFGARLHPEMLTSQLEAASEICADLDDVRRAVAAMRAEAAEAAAAHGASLLATSTHPTATLDQIDVAERERYVRLLDRHASLVTQLNLCGAHVHVAIPDLETAVAVMNQARRYLPVLAALTGSSPFHEGADTGFGSIRLARLALWPQGGLPPWLPSAQAFRSVVAQLVGTGIVDEQSEILWELRPSARTCKGLSRVIVSADTAE